LERAAATPLLVGAAGSPLELTLNSLYFRAEVPEPLEYGEVSRVAGGGLARAIPLHVRFRARGHPIVGTTLDYFPFRGLRIAEGRQLAMLGECVAGYRAARSLAVAAGDAVISSPESAFDLAGVYPLKMTVVGVLGHTDTPDDDAIFVDLKTAWVIQGLGHGHGDLTAGAGVLSREGNRVTADASVLQYNEITPENVDSFHFHGDLARYPVTAVIAIPSDVRSGTLLQGRYEEEGIGSQIVRPEQVMRELLATVLTVRNFVLGGAVLVGTATLASTCLVFLLSLRLRRREAETLHKIGGSRRAVATVMGAEVGVVLLAGTGLATGLTLLAMRFGSILVRTLIRM
ncbi:MAG: hypothetical protein PVF68_17310, partial [Acidobacteriota bacterium]